MSTLFTAGTANQFSSDAEHADRFCIFFSTRPLFTLALVWLHLQERGAVLCRFLAQVILASFVISPGSPLLPTLEQPRPFFRWIWSEPCKILWSIELIVLDSCGPDLVLFRSMGPNAPLLFLSIQNGDSVGSRTFDQTAPNTDRRAVSRRRGGPPFRPAFEVDVGNTTTFASMRRNAHS
mmetsp:Transcript_10258/g.62740  ORF Transcript_10258/g.62740 Transcript_10258/m.62740 type:complete len:179 (-) Transcript_10258:3831-4367(-)